MAVRKIGLMGMLFCLVTAFLIPSPGHTEGKKKADEKVVSEKKQSDEKVASVNGIIISQTEMNRELDNIRRQFMQKGRALTDEQMAEIKDEILDNIIDQKLLYLESKQQGLKVEAKDIDAKIQELRSRYPSEDEFKGLLTELNFTEADLKSDLERRMAVNQLLETKIAKNVTIPENEIKEYYQKTKENFKQPARVKASHILIKVEPEAKDEAKAAAKKKIGEIEQKLKKGEDFAALAKEHSECPSAKDGGDLGYFGKGQMVEPFEEAAFKMKPGEVSGVVETRFGYHLIKSVDQQPEKIVEFEMMKDRISQFLQQEKVQQEILKYVAELKKKAKIEKFPPKS